MEGRIEDCDKPTSVSSYTEANNTLLMWSVNAPKTGGYKKCSFVVTYEDDNTYSGRYDLSHYTKGQDEGPEICLQLGMKQFLQYEADQDLDKSAQEFMDTYEL